MFFNKNLNSSRASEAFCCNIRDTVVRCGKMFWTGTLGLPICLCLYRRFYNTAVNSSNPVPATMLNGRRSMLHKCATESVTIFFSDVCRVGSVLCVKKLVNAEVPGDLQFLAWEYRADVPDLWGLWWNNDLHRIHDTQSSEDSCL